jgi:hypothetical protein
MERLITTEVENALLLMHYTPTSEWSERRSASVVADEKALTQRACRRVLDIFYDVAREFTHIELGLIDSDQEGR